MSLNLTDISGLKDKFESGKVLYASDLDTLVDAVKDNQEVINAHNETLDILQENTGANEEKTPKERLKELEEVVGISDDNENSHEIRIDNLEASNASKPGTIIEGKGEIFNLYKSYIKDDKTINANQATGTYSHAEGHGTKASGNWGSHAEGNNTQATAANGSHAEGSNTEAHGTGSHAEGNGSKVEKNAIAGHAEGSNTVVKARDAHAEGSFTVASAPYQHVQGKYNIEDTVNETTGLGQYAHIVGNGTSNDRSNAHTLDWNGNAWYAGTVEATTFILLDNNNNKYELYIDAASNIAAKLVEEV